MEGPAGEFSAGLGLFYRGVNVARRRKEDK